ncbi:TPA: hypothetical protein N0F65_006632 [Lagenidium giganteum]|uniref:Uncharacterized protein n=1 Tax=Lagenidium giganteum TaxID=4803 RepID=A0AAV2Z7Z8_9STRA|nr:TPA: hypothetical protein N0F65_006632 [Lagenidium giganteum]
MPLVMSTSLPKASTLLVQLEDSKLDLSGDVGAIGRFHSQDDGGVVLDIKGHQYIGEIVPCGTFMVVGIGATEAKVENMVTDFCQITQKLSVIESISGVVLAGKTGEVSSSDEGAESPTRTGKPAATLKGRKRKKASSDDDDDSDADSDASEAKAPASTAKKPRKTPTKTKTPAKKATKSPAKPPAKTPAKKTPAKTKAASASKAKSAKKAPPKK